ncbi:hypothetical protein IT415_00100 [bacterium]|nr:hypothetical protein [bacterium]
MRRVGIMLLAILVGCLHLTIHGLSSSAVVPNIMIITIISFLHRWWFEDLAVFSITLGVVLEMSSLSSTGAQIIACLLIVLIGKVVLRQATETSQAGFLIVLGVCVTLAYNLAIFLTLSSTSLTSGITTVLLRSGLECVYNVLGIAFGHYILFAGRESTAQYKLPR